MQRRDLTSLSTKNKARNKYDTYKNDAFDAIACLYQNPEKDQFKFFITYRGKPTEELSKAFKTLNAPCKDIISL